MIGFQAEFAAPDLTGFPILRIDQIPFIETKILRDAEVEILILIQNSYDDGSSSMASYLKKQLDYMRKELTNRAASSRVHLLLEQNSSSAFDSSNVISGLYSAEPSVTTTVMLSRSSDALLSPHTNKSEMSREIPQDNTNILSARSFSIPLPSELNREYAATKNKEMKSSPTSNMISERPNLRTTVRDNMNSSKDIRIDNKDNNSSVDYDYVIEEDNNYKKPLRRPSSGNPSRRAVIVMNENFGSTFLVSATEKKKRFLPKKVQPENPEEIRENERLQRSVCNLFNTSDSDYVSI